MRLLHLPRRVAHLLSVTLVASAVTTGAVGPSSPRPPKVTSVAVQLSSDTRESGWRTTLAPPAPTEMVGFEWKGGAGAVAVRARTSGGWSDWAEVTGNPDEGPDPGSPEHRPRQQAGPVWVGQDVRELEVEVREGVLDDLRLHAIHSPTPAASGVGPDAAAALPSQPGIISRAEWGADEGWRTYASGCDGNPSYASRVRNAFVHHTDSVNNYSAAEAAALVRGIYYFHTHTNGWCDIGYNFLVDRFGRVYEGRYGGVTKAVIGAHTGGFNTGSTGVALLGSHGSEAMSAAARSSLVTLLAWKLGHHGVDTRTTVQVTSGGSSRYEMGRVVSMPTIAGHRDASLTACPGELAYRELPSLRVEIQRQILATAPDPLPGWTPSATGEPAVLTLNAFGGLIPAGSQASVTHRAYWAGFPVVRAALRETKGGLVLDGWGGLHAFGNASPRQPSTYWPGWDIARAVASGPVAGSGWVVDGFGGFHPFGGIPRPLGGRYFGWDIVRSAVSAPNGAGGYVLDGFGGLHPYGTAAPVTITRYWNGWDIARDIALRPDGVSGWVLDGWGGLHPFGGAPPVSSSMWWPGTDAARGVVLDATGDRGWVVDDSGGLWPFGGAPALKPFLTYTGTGLARDVVIASSPAAS